MTEAAEPYKSTCSALLRAARWLRRQWLYFVLCSAVLLIPCFWHAHVQACDLGSHLYNAWLTQTVAQGYLPGLHLDRQYTNVLFDFLLSNLFPYLGPTAAERVAVAFCVLMFFWGSFAFASAAAQRPAWSVIPLLVMVSYGAIFHLGFFNFYLSAGFSLLALALIVCGTTKDLLLLPILLILAALAHPLGAACLVALGLFLAALRWLPLRPQLTVTFFLVAGSFALRAYLVRRFEVLPREIPFYWLLGADQLIVFSHRYFWISLAIVLLSIATILLALRRQPIATLAPWLQFYCAIALIVCFAPGGLLGDSFGMLGYLPDRGSLYSIVALAALLACCRPRPWFAAASTVVALVFFTMLYRDTNLLERRYEKVAELVRPYTGRRIIGLLPSLPGSRIHEDHSLDRACVGHCYAYANYEPSSAQFRLHAEPDNRIVEVDQPSLDAMQDGSYVVQSRDLPLAEVYQCGAAFTDLCITDLHAGQQNGDIPDLQP